ncbi:MAG: hypothetical protein H0V63_08370 [Burkholderiaceae bacterium]|nr:hypothetical protein [Burkholderiaceae bacterium]
MQVVNHAACEGNAAARFIRGTDDVGSILKHGCICYSEHFSALGECEQLTQAVNGVGR